MKSLKGRLPLLDKSHTTDLLDPRYRDYFAFYGFDQLNGLYDDYHFGAIASEIRCACHYWRLNSAKRTVLVVHGLFDHVALYLPLVKNLLEQGLNVVAIDLPDHGFSDAEYGSLDSFAYYSQSIDATVTSEQLEITSPLTLIGQSTGGAVLFDYLATYERPNDLDQLVLLAPLLRAKGWRTIGILYRILWWKKSVRRKFRLNSHDESFCHFLRDRDPTQPKFVSVAWTGAMIRWAKQFGRLPKQNIATLYVQGTDDHTVDFDYNIAQYRNKLEPFQLCMIDGARHHLVGEADPWRAQVFSAINQFVVVES